jgi:hypothetical protein
LVAYQHWAWILDADISQKTGIDLGSLVHSMWLAFYNRTWKNSFNIAGKLSKIKTLDK